MMSLISGLKVDFVTWMRTAALVFMSLELLSMCSGVHSFQAEE